jgi:hypothetical protein
MGSNMFLFISEITGPESIEVFATRFRGELLEKFRSQGMVVSIWSEYEVNNG